MFILRGQSGQSITLEFTFTHTFHITTTKYETLLKSVVLKHNQSLKDWAEKQYYESSYLSKTTDIEILCCISSFLDIHDSNIIKHKYFSLMTYELTNIKNVCELILIFRFETEFGEIKKLFLCIIELSGIDTLTLPYLRYF